ncbi:diguanylate cyclase (GGDEF) domain-containing protein [Shewanella psychrophila]|uniref:diguanylate cyclase n=1 Tax=Shewanella psychrophila TaxID=225848 RepID=A0A1S6HVM0_9GAMM|nr:GGDEF domain-containing protein [Shewanella psychrophila]AQS39620.1 diguanylate cyclase (GGDEF) domain-containing protein [Shewanella psychrophila]
MIANSLPSDDCIAARYGGEEFALILPGFDAKQAQLMAEYIQLEINSLKYTDFGLDESVTVSVSQGIAAEVDGQFRMGTALLCAADTALYRAKADGRNRINLSC